MVDNLSIAVYTLSTFISISVDEILLPKYMNKFTYFTGFKTHILHLHRALHIDGFIVFSQKYYAMYRLGYMWHKSNVIYYWKNVKISVVNIYPILFKNYASSFFKHRNLCSLVICFQWKWLYFRLVPKRSWMFMFSSLSLNIYSLVCIINENTRIIK